MKERLSLRRDIRLDSLKGIVILLVVLSHAMQDFPATGSYLPLRLLTFIDMPLFMMLTGYTLGYSKPRSPSKQIAHRARTLLIPYFVWGLLGPLLYGEMPSVSMVLIGGPWFLSAVFLFEVMLITFKRFTQNPYWLVGCAWLTAIGAYIIAALPILDSIRLVEDVAHFFLFYVVGNVAFYALPALKGHRRQVGIIASLLLAVFGLSLLVHFMVGRLEPAAWSRIATTISTEAARVSIGLFAGLFAAFGIRKVKEEKLGTLAWIGSMSLGIYLIHIYLRHRVYGSGWGAVIAAFICWVGISIGGTLIIQRYPLANTLLLGGRTPSAPSSKTHTST